MKQNNLAFLQQLEDIIVARREAPVADSYTSSLFAAGTQRIAQKVGEEAVEVALAACNDGADKVADEAADLIYHLLVLLTDRKITMAEVARVLESRHADT